MLGSPFFYYIDCTMNPNPFHPIFTIPALALVATVGVSCARPAPPRTDFVMGTVCTINLGDKGTEKLYDEAFARLRVLDALLSANSETGNVAEINAGAGLNPVRAAEETLTVLSAALEFSEATNGAFDPTIGPLVKLWGIGLGSERVPPRDEIDRALALSGYRKVDVDRAAGTVYLRERGMRLDLGAIAKGYAADEIARLLSSRGITSGIIDLGGNILAMGEKAPGKPWTVGIRDPQTSQGGAVMSLRVANRSIVTSGIYERFFEENGRHYHHILDPSTGFPAEGELLSVTIISPQSIQADALSTSAFLLGTERGLELVSRYPDTEAVFVDRGLGVRTSEGLRGRVTALDSRFVLHDDD